MSATYYKEHPIRCKTCFEPIASRTFEFELLLNNGMTVEEALNAMDIMEPCSRIAMMNPTFVFYNLEHRGVVEGTTSVEAAVDQVFSVEQLINGIDTTNISFHMCDLHNRREDEELLEDTDLIEYNKLGGQELSINRQIENVLSTRMETNIPGLYEPQNVAVELNEDVIKLNEDVDIKLDENVDELEFGNVGEAISVQAPMQSQLKISPKVVGIPVINPNPSADRVTIHVGAGAYVEVLTGRTYLAR